MEEKLQLGNSLYESPKLEVVLLNTVDIICTSPNTDPTSSIPENGNANNDAWFGL